MEGRKEIQFTAGATPYQAGETAWFVPTDAKRYVDSDLAFYLGREKDGTAFACDEHGEKVESNPLDAEGKVDVPKPVVVTEDEALAFLEARDEFEAEIKAFAARKGEAIDALDAEKTEFEKAKIEFEKAKDAARADFEAEVNEFEAKKAAFEAEAKAKKK